MGGLKVLWSAQDGSDPLTAPAVVNGTVFTGDNAFNAATGKLLWSSASLGDAISPAVVNGTAYIDTQGGLCAFAATGGALLWCAGPGNYLPDAPSGAAVANGIVYFGSAVGSIFAFDAATGAQLWSAPISTDNAASSPAVADGVVYISGDGLLAFDAKTGAQLWSSSMAGGGSPTVVGGVVYETTGTGLAALNAKTGAVIWSVSPGGPLSIAADSPAVAQGLAYFGTYFPGPHGTSIDRFYAIDAQTGKTVWSVPLASEPFGSPAVANGVVYVGTYGGTLYAFNAKTGAQLATVAGVSGESSPTVANGVVYSETIQGELFALGVGASAASPKP